MAKKHGPPLGVSKKKTFKDIKTESADYRAKCKTGYKGGFNNAHHLIPCTSLKLALIEYLDGQPLEYKRALAFFTKWDVNAGNNLMGLPTFDSYRIAFAGMESRNLSTGLAKWFNRASNLASKMMGPKYPIHIPSDWGHDRYNTTAQKAVKRLWVDLVVQHENHDPIDPPDFGEDLKGLSGDYRTKLRRKTGQSLELWKKSPKKNSLFRMD